MVFECLSATEKDLYCVNNFEVSRKGCEETYGDIMYMLDGRGYFALPEQEPNTEACSFYMSETITNIEVRLKSLLSNKEVRLRHCCLIQK